MFGQFVLCVGLWGFIKTCRDTSRHDDKPNMKSPHNKARGAVQNVAKRGLKKASHAFANAYL